MTLIENLTSSLREAGVPAGAGGRSLTEVAEILAAIAAAPPTPQGFTGVSMLGAGPAAAALSRLAAETAARYEAGAEPGRDAATRLAALRRTLSDQGLTGFVVPLNDEYNGEYVPRRARRLAWLTGFTGSAGIAIVLGERAAVFSDGRYTLQLAQEVDSALYTRHHVIEEPPHVWLAASLKSGDRLGYDPWLHTIDGVARLAEACRKAGAELVPVDRNPIDAVWTDQPPPPLSPAVPLPVSITGEAPAQKRRRIAALAAKEGASATVLTLPESIAWLLDIRGGDVPHTPLPLSFAILKDDASVDLYIDPRKLDGVVRAHLGNEVAVHPPEAFADGLAALGARQATVRIDQTVAAAWIVDKLKSAGAKPHLAADPCLLPKACKNAIELNGIRTAHLRDGVAVSRFLAWLSAVAPEGGVDELAAAEKLFGFRLMGDKIRDLSFPTISGSGPNGAIVHYRSTPASNRNLRPGELYLVDSGAQYLDGTTDITRTVAIGTPSAEMRRHFTLVLKGHIALATALFPVGTTGSQLDALARMALWRAGLDYDHGTGHGVGHYLSVHEGPQRISKVASTVRLEPGMIISNEPGYYKTGAYGIRIENLVAVADRGIPDGGERPMLGFETLTKAPIDRYLIDVGLLSPDEIAWLDAYHAQVRADLRSLLDPETAIWLDAATAPLG